MFWYLAGRKKTQSVQKICRKEIRKLFTVTSCCQWEKRQKRHIQIQLKEMSHYQNWTNMTPSPVQRGTLRTSWGLPSGNISFFRRAIGKAYACYELVDFSVQCQLSVPAEKCVYWTFFCTLSSFSWAQKGHIYIPTKKGVFSLYIEFCCRVGYKQIDTKHYILVEQTVSPYT